MTVGVRGEAGRGGKKPRRGASPKFAMADAERAGPPRFEHERRTVARFEHERARGARFETPGKGNFKAPTGALNLS